MGLNKLKEKVENFP